jgi:hypothetical protein
VVPEYLRDPPQKSRLLLAAAIMLLVGATIGLLWVTVYPGGWRWVQAKMHGKSADDEDQDDRRDKKFPSPSGSEPGKSSANALAGSEGTAGSNGQATARAGNSPPAGTADQSVMPAGGNPAGQSEVAVAAKPPEKPAPGPAPAATPGSTPAAPAPSGTASTALPPAGVAATPPVPSVAATGNAAKPATPPRGQSPEPSPPNPPVGPANVDSSVASNTGMTPSPVRPSPPVAGQDRAKIGRFTSDGQQTVLLKEEANNAGWRRVLPEDFLAGHQPLLSLPSFRPQVVVLNVDARLELINGTRIELLPDNPQGLPGVEIDFGRVVIKPLTQAGTSLRVVVGSHAGTLRLTNKAIAGLEATRVREPGTDPEKVRSHALTRLYLVQGSASWEEGEGTPPVQLAAPATLPLDGAATDVPPGAAKEAHKWITDNIVNELDQRAAIDVSKGLSADRAASLGLMELREDRRKEVRGLADRCLGYLGQFDPMTAAFDDPDLHFKWPEFVDQLKEAIAQGPETAATVRRSLEKRYGEDAAALYRMLWGYTDKDLEGGEDARLVKYLDHELPVFREFAFENLRDITQKSLYYYPELTPAKRHPAVQQWQQLQKSGRIRHNLPEVKPRTAPAGVPPKENIPEPPKPLNGGVPSEVQPASAAEPAEPGAANARPSRRLSVSVPEPDPPERWPRIAFPEPQPGNEQ